MKMKGKASKFKKMLIQRFGGNDFLNPLITSSNKNKRCDVNVIFDDAGVRSEQILDDFVTTFLKTLPSRSRHQPSTWRIIPGIVSG